MKGRGKNISINIIFYFALAILVLVWLLPITFVVITAFKTNAEFYSTPVFSLPTSLAWENFERAFIRSNLYVYMGNGLFVSLCKLPIGIFLSSLTAFALTRLKLKHSNGIFILFLIGMMIPLQSILLPVCIAANGLNMTNNLLSLVVIYTGINLPFGILVMRGFMRAIPFEIDESARVDGCTNMRLYWSIIMPIAKPAISTLVILDFLSSWNEFLFSSILMTSDSKRTVPSGIMVFFGETVTEYTKLCAGILILVIPVLVVYLIFQKYFIEGMAGAVKG